MTNIKTLKVNLFCVFFGCTIPFVESIAGDLYFYPGLISDDSVNAADFEGLNYKGNQLPGDYKVSVFINGEFFHEKKMKFIKSEDTDVIKSSGKNDIRDDTGLVVCINYADLESFNVNLSLLSLPDDIIRSECISLGDIIRDAYTKFDFQRMRLDVSIPQDAMNHIAQGYISPDKWDNGIDSVILNYHFNDNRIFTNDAMITNSSLNFHGGVNLGAWRFRDITNYYRYSSKKNSHSEWEHLKTWAERPIISLKSHFQIGNLTSSDDVFDNLSFYGVQLYTDDNMYPDSLRGFAPTVRGNARTNARVTIRQNGSDVYQTMVSPGNFTINDLYPVYSSGDLDVTVHEADGSTQFFVVPYSSVPLLQREGQGKYSLASGSVRETGNNKNLFIQGSVIRGFSHGITAYSGLQLSDNYRSFLGGVGLNLGTLGAVSADITQASSQLSDNKKDNGHSLRFRYARSLESTGTTVQVAGYRYSSEGYYSLDEVTSGGNDTLRTWCDNPWSQNNNTQFVSSCDNDTSLRRKKKEKLQINLSQELGDAGSLFITGTEETYHRSEEKTRSYQMGINSYIGSANYSLSFNYMDSSFYEKADKSLYFNVSLPLSSLLPFTHSSDDVRASYMLDTRKGGNTTHRVSVSGSSLERHNFNWDVTQVMSDREKNAGSMNGSYYGQLGMLNGGYSYGDGYKQINYGASGGVIVHGNGITFGQTVGDTAVLIAVPGINDIPVENEIGVSTDSRGYAIKPFASSYRENRVALDVSDVDYTTDIENPVVTVVPTKGAIVQANFEGRQGQVFIMTLKNQGRKLPFGSMVAAGESNGVINEFSRVYLSGMSEKGTGNVQWGASSNEQCEFLWDISAMKTKGKKVHKIAVECQ